MNLLLFNLKTDADDPVLGFTTRWINALAPYFEQIHVVTMAAGRLDVAGNVKVYSLGKEKGYSELRRAVEFYRILLWVLRAVRITACFAHMNPLFAVMAAPVLRLRRIPSVLWYAHGHVPLLLRLAERLTDRIITSSERGFRLKSGKLRVVGQGIEVVAAAPPPPNPDGEVLRLLYVGRLSAVKGVELAVEAVALFRRRSPLPVRLTIVGGPLTDEDAAYVERLKERIANAGLAEAVLLAGSRPPRETRQFYAECDIFINPSRTGSMDKTVLEAMGAGRLVITGNEAYDTAEFRAAGGIFVANDSAAIAEALLAVAMAPAAEWEERSRAGRRWVLEQHSLTRLAERIAKEIRELSAQS